MLRFHLVIAACLFLAGMATAQVRELQVLQDAVRKVIDDNEPSVACILVSRSERYRDLNGIVNGPEGKLGGFDPRPYFDPARKDLLRRLDLANPDPIPDSYGSGVIIDRGGLVLTNFHVVQNATKIYVRLANKTGSYADIHAADGRSDLAVLKLINPPEGLKPIRLGDGDRVRKGDFVVGIANPFAAGFRDGSPTASHGIVGNLRRKGLSSGSEHSLRTIHELGTLIQTDLRLNLGCSGGAVLDLDGAMIGLASSTAAIVGGETPGGFAVPMSSSIKRIVDVLKRGEEVEYGLLGIGFDNLNTPQRPGAEISQVQDGSPAKRAGLMVGEIITEVGDSPINDYDDLLLNIGTALAGSEVTLTVKSFGGRLRKVTLRLSKFHFRGITIASNRPSPVYGLRVDYSSVADVNVPVPDGVFIREVEPGSAAERKYRELLESSRWIITTVNGKSVSAPADFYREAAAVKGTLELKIVEAAKTADSTPRSLSLP